MSCVVCNRVIRDDEIFYSMKCGNPEHIAHGDHRTRECPLIECRVPVDAPVSSSAPMGAQAAFPPVRQQQQQQQQVAVQSLEDKALEARRAASQRRWKEPLVHRRERNFSVRVAGSLLESISRAMEAGKPDEKSSNPMVQLKAGISLQEIVHRGNDITEFINDYGATINDFFSQGWTLDQVRFVFFFCEIVSSLIHSLKKMCDAFGSRMNPHEGMEVLKQLQITPEHFKFGLKPVIVAEDGQSRQYMTIECLVNRLGYRPECMIKDFGFEWTPQWSVADMVNLGINIEMAVQSGMTDAFQWMHVKAAATPEQLAAFRWTPEWDTLLSRQPHVQPQQQPISAPLYAQPMAPQQATYTPQQALYSQTVAPQQATYTPQQAPYVQQMAPAFAAPATSVALPPSTFVPALVKPPAPPVQQQKQSMVLPVIHQVVPMQDTGKRHVVQAIQMSAPLPVPAVPVNDPNQMSSGRPKLLPFPVIRYK